MRKQLRSSKDSLVKRNDRLALAVRQQIKNNNQVLTKTSSKKSLVIGLIAIAAVLILGILLLFTDQFVGKAYTGTGVQYEAGLDLRGSANILPQGESRPYSVKANVGRNIRINALRFVLEYDDTILSVGTEANCESQVLGSLDRIFGKNPLDPTNIFAIISTVDCIPGSAGSNARIEVEYVAACNPTNNCANLPAGADTDSGNRNDLGSNAAGDTVLSFIPFAGRSTGTANVFFSSFEVYDIAAAPGTNPLSLDFPTQSNPSRITVYPTSELGLCGDRNDNDRDGRGIDCLDTDCIGDPACQNLPAGADCTPDIYPLPSMCASGVCSNFVCVQGICTPDAWSCTQDSLSRQQCNSIGTAYANPISCGPNAICRTVGSTISCVSTGVDTDGDGILDSVDNCLAVSNPNQADADGDNIGDVCDVDTDRDGIADPVDNCPNLANPDQADTDNDDIGNACDNCPVVSNIIQTDSDVDRIGDSCDNCPAVSNTNQANTYGGLAGDACEIQQTCGNGIVEGTEVCDDGNIDGAEGCNLACNGIVAGWTCPAPTATGICTPICGDNRAVGTEQCDDGNTVSNDGCSSICRTEVLAGCGDGRLQTNEQCDDGNRVDGDRCSRSCVIEIAPGCGDGRLQTGEQCDDGNTNNRDSCTNQCLFARCGDGIIRTDISNTGVSQYEACDDGNTATRDGCWSNCRVDIGYICTGEPSACTETTPPTFVVNPNYREVTQSSAVIYAEINERGYCRYSLPAPPNFVPMSAVNSGETKFETQLTGLNPGRRYQYYIVCGDISGNEQAQRILVEFTTAPSSVCGNGIIEPGELCDGSSLGVATCQNQRFSGGTLRCTSRCTLDTSGCTTQPICGDRLIEGIEECDDGNAVGGDGCSSICQNEDSGCTTNAQCNNLPMRATNTCGGTIPNADCFVCETVSRQCVLMGDIVLPLGTVNVQDALQVLRRASGLRTAPGVDANSFTTLQEVAADVTCGGGVTVGDALQVLRLAAGIRSGFDQC